MTVLDGGPPPRAGSRPGGTNERRLPRWAAGRPFVALGPAFVAAVAYVDPGNVATNVSAGARFGTTLLWVVVLATAVAGVVQYLSAKLGVVSGRSLPDLVAARSRTRAGRLAYWAQAEAVAVATDIAEVVGAAVGLHLLLGVPLVAGGVIAGAVGMAVLGLRDRRGPRSFEALCVLGLVVIGSGFASGLVRVPPVAGDLARGLVPGLSGADQVLLAAGIVGATVMPHAVYVHSALTADVSAGGPLRTVAQRLSDTRWDVTLAMVVAGGINISMLVLGASALAGGGELGLGEASALLEERAGGLAALGFSVALLVSGLTSTAVGTHAGSVIMDGLLRRRVPVPVRRLAALVPALVLLGSGAEPLTVLVLSQVGLALGLPFALVPLLRITHDRAVMGEHVDPPGLALVARVIAAAVVLLDLALVVLTLLGS